MEQTFFYFTNEYTVVASSAGSESLSEALILVSTNPQYDKRLFIKIPSSEHAENHKLLFVLTFRTIYVHNMF